MELSDVLALDDAQKANDWKIMQGTSLYRKAVAALVSSGKYDEIGARQKMDGIMRRMVREGKPMPWQVRQVVIAALKN